MGIQQIFVSHAGKDAGVATELAQQLRNAGHDARIDTRDLALGDNAIEFMNEGISNAAAVIILFSGHSLKAEWQKLEIDAARWNEVAQGGGRCIVVRLDDTPLPPTLGPKAYGRLKPGDRGSLRKLVEDVCKVLFSGQTTSSLVAEAFRPDSENPFRHLRAEFFEDQPELHAKTFALPEAVKVGALDDMKPCILEGSRGTGKSMLLLSLRARNRLLRLPAEKDAPQRFGFYLKLTRGAICNAGARFDAERLDSTVDTVVLTDVAEQELTVQMTESLFSELEYCAKHGLIECDRNVERRLCEAADDLLFDAGDGGVVSFVDLQGKLGKLHKRLAEFIRRRFIYQEQVSVPTATFDLDQFKRVVQLVRRNVPPLASSMFVVLLDEYENLFLHQKRLVNSLVKLGAPQMSVKISRKLASGDTPATTTGQELQEIHDYTRVSLVYNLDDPGERKAYCGLLRHMVGNMVALEGDRPFDMDQLLPRFGDPEVEQSSCLTEVARLNKMTVEEFNDLPDDKRREKKTYYGHAAVYRVLSRPARPPSREAFRRIQRTRAVGVRCHPLLSGVPERGLPPHFRRRASTRGSPRSPARPAVEGGPRGVSAQPHDAQQERRALRRGTQVLPAGSRRVSAPQAAQALERAGGRPRDDRGSGDVGAGPDGGVEAGSCSRRAGGRVSNQGGASGVQAQARLRSATEGIQHLPSLRAGSSDQPAFALENHVEVPAPAGSAGTRPESGRGAGVEERGFERRRRQRE